MVVEYWKLPNLRIGARPFHAVLRCGEAATLQDLRTEAEQFLRSAEPPSHDAWVLTPDIKATYERGGGARIGDLRSAVRAELRELVAPSSADAEDGPEILKRMLAISVPPERTNEPKVTRIEGGVVDGVWQLDVTVTARPRQDHQWCFRPLAKVVGETGAVAVDIATVTNAKWATMDGPLVTMDAGRRQSAFRVTIDSQSLPGAPEDVAVDVTLTAVKAVAA